jgi:hypothetical protein
MELDGEQEAEAAVVAEAAARPCHRRTSSMVLC